MTFPGRPTARDTRLVALLLALLALSGCSNLALPQQALPPAAAADPAYRTQVGDYLKAAFKTLPPVNTFEISEPRWVHSVAGWNWLACVRFQDRGRLLTYALFINHNAIVDARYAVETDACASQAYSPLDLGSGATGPAAVGGQGPLY